jgi:hypothetical protein
MVSGNSVIMFLHVDADAATKITNQRDACEDILRAVVATVLAR